MVVQYIRRVEDIMSRMSCREMDLLRQLSRLIGETVTVFTTSGGESGRGFTGVLIRVSADPFITLVTDIGPAPACALGSCCDRKHGRCKNEDEDFEDEDEDERSNSRRNRLDCRFRSAGAVVEIPINRIAAFVHNTLG
jgi:hypothetical protein